MCVAIYIYFFFRKTIFRFCENAHDAKMIILWHTIQKTTFQFKFNFEIHKYFTIKFPFAYTYIFYLLISGLPWKHRKFYFAQFFVCNDLTLHKVCYFANHTPTEYYFCLFLGYLIGDTDGIKTVIVIFLIWLSRTRKNKIP